MSSDILDVCVLYKKEGLTICLSIVRWFPKFSVTTLKGVSCLIVFLVLFQS